LTTADSSATWESASAGAGSTGSGHRPSWAAAARCPRTFIGSGERGERNPSILNLRLIVKTLRVPLADLLAEGI
jgi:hypothetical protein